VPIHYELGDDHVVTITIDRPEHRNSLDMEHFYDLRCAWDRFGDQDEAWVAIITGVGRDFCVGADLKTYIPQVTALQAQIKSGEVPEVGGYRLDDGVKAVLRNVKLYKPITANGPFAIRKTKESVIRGLATDMKEAYKIESELSGQVFSSQDAKEGPRAFAEKRAPDWKNC
jgi:enoyl-CoA hydratase/carnithine racemase